MFNKKLKQARLESNLNQKEFAKLLNVKNTTISNWELGISNPDISMIDVICEILNVDANYLFSTYDNIEYSRDEKQILESYRKLDIYGKKQVTSVINNELDRCKQQEKNNDYDCVSKTEYITSLSAGNGLYIFNDIPIKTILVPKKYDFIDFVISINGDSMEPYFRDGDKVLIKKQSKIEIGEIGIFMLNGNGYIKELGNNCLISKNKKYPPIELNEYTDCYCIGKVIDKLNIKK